MYTVVCCGDSITRGQVSANYVEILEKNLGQGGFAFINSGVNNDFSHNLLQRLDAVVAHQPDFVTILIGTNDVIATIDPLGLEVGLLIKGLPSRPDLAMYRGNIQQIVQRLKNETKAQIGLISIPILGEDIESLPVQRVLLYNEVLKEIAAQEQISYLPLFERQVDYITANLVKKGRPFEGELLSSIELLAKRILLKEEYNSISQEEGFVLLVEGVHLNEIAAAMVADTIEGFIERKLHHI